MHKIFKIFYRNLSGNYFRDFKAYIITQLHARKEYVKNNEKTDNIMKLCKIIELDSRPYPCVQAMNKSDSVILSAHFNFQFFLLFN